MPASPREFFRHILDECEYVAGQVQDLSREQLVRDETAKRAIEREHWRPPGAWRVTPAGAASAGRRSG